MTASGQRLLDLLHNEWTTHIRYNLTNGNSFTFDGYHGDYDITIYHQSKPIMHENFSLGKSDIVNVIHINGNGGNTSAYIYGK